jgi:hypothetical protein
MTCFAVVLIALFLKNRFFTLALFSVRKPFSPLEKLTQLAVYLVSPPTPEKGVGN